MDSAAANGAPTFPGRNRVGGSRQRVGNRVSARRLVCVSRSAPWGCFDSAAGRRSATIRAGNAGSARRSSAPGGESGRGRSCPPRPDQHRCVAAICETSDAAARGRQATDPDGSAGGGCPRRDNGAHLCAAGVGGTIRCGTRGAFNGSGAIDRGAPTGGEREVVGVAERGGRGLAAGGTEVARATTRAVHARFGSAAFARRRRPRCGTGRIAAQRCRNS